MKRILLLIKGLGRGGAEQLLLNAVPYLDRDRFHYEVGYLLPWKDALVGELQAAGLPVHCLDGARGPRWVERLVSLVASRRIHLVHAHSPVPAIGARIAFPRRRHVCLVYTEHNVWQRYHRATYWGNLLTFPRNDHVIAVSEHVRASIRYPAGVRRLPMPHVETRYYGIDRAVLSRQASTDGIREELGLAKETPVVGTVANFKLGKGHDHLLGAVARVRTAIPEVRFVLVGGGPLEPEVRRMAGELGVEGCLVFAGYREDAPRVMGAFDVIAVPSVYDGLSIALLEAMSLGKPPVLTRVGGNPEAVLHGREGLIVPPGEPNALASAIVTLLRDQDLRTRLGRAAERRAAQFDIRDAVRRTEEIYTTLLEGTAAPVRTPNRSGSRSQGDT